MKKYLFYDFKNHIGGLDDHLKGLSDIISLSVSLNRIPVISEFHTAPRHNFNFRKLVQFQDYVDLSKTCIFRDSASGPAEQVAPSLYWLSEQDFDIQSFSEEQVVHVYISNNFEIRALEENIKNIFDKKLDHYKVLYIQNRSHRKPIYSLRSIFYRRIDPQALLKSNRHPYLVILQPSQVVENLAKVVLNRIGIDLNEMTNLKKALMTKYRSEDMRIVQVIRAQICFYACLHVRATDRLKDIKYYFAYQPRQIKKTIQRAKLPLGSRIYIMSDVRDREYFNFLQSDYRIYTYHDFPELKQLVSGKDGSMNNYMLYSVEKNIMGHAPVQIMAPSRPNPLFLLNLSLNSSFHVPFWVKCKYFSYMINTNPKNLRHRVFLFMREIIKSNIDRYFSTGK